MSLASHLSENYDYRLFEIFREKLNYVTFLADFFFFFFEKQIVQKLCLTALSIITLVLYWRHDFFKNEGLIMALIHPSCSQQCLGKQHVLLHSAIRCSIPFKLREGVYNRFHIPLFSGVFKFFSRNSAYS